MASYSAFNSTWHNQLFFSLYQPFKDVFFFLVRCSILGYETQFSKTRSQLCNSLAWAARLACSSPTSEGSWVPGAWRGSEEASWSVASPDTLSNPLLTLSLWDKGGLEKWKLLPLSLFWRWNSPTWKDVLSLPDGQIKVRLHKLVGNWAAYTPATWPPIEVPTRWNSCLSRPMLWTNCRNWSTKKELKRSTSSKLQELQSGYQRAFVCH